MRELRQITRVRRVTDCDCQLILQASPENDLLYMPRFGIRQLQNNCRRIPPVRRAHVHTVAHVTIQRQCQLIRRVKVGAEHARTFTDNGIFEPHPKISTAMRLRY